MLVCRREKGLWTFFDFPDADAHIVPVSIVGSSVKGDSVRSGIDPD